MSASLLLSAVIPGEPVGKGRPVRDSRSGRTFLPKKTQNWQDSAAAHLAALWKQPPLEGAVAVRINAVAGRPKRLQRKKDFSGRIRRTTKPDVDNVVKAALDALVKAGVLRDDTQVTEVHALSYYASMAEGPSVEIGVVTDPEWVVG